MSIECKLPAKLEKKSKIYLYKNGTSSEAQLDTDYI